MPSPKRKEEELRTETSIKRMHTRKLQELEGLKKDRIKPFQPEYIGILKVLRAKVEVLAWVLEIEKWEGI